MRHGAAQGPLDRANLSRPPPPPSPSHRSCPWPPHQLLLKVVQLWRARPNLDFHYQQGFDDHESWGQGLWEHAWGTAGVEEGEARLLSWLPEERYRAQSRGGTSSDGWDSGSSASDSGSEADSDSQAEETDSEEAGGGAESACASGSQGGVDDA